MKKKDLKVLTIVNILIVSLSTDLTMGAGCPPAAHWSHMEQISMLQPLVKQVDVGGAAACGEPTME